MFEVGTGSVHLALRNSQDWISITRATRYTAFGAQNRSPLLSRFTYPRLAYFIILLCSTEGGREKINKKCVTISQATAAFCYRHL